ncbi:MAG TPA: hypothetical protein VH853_01135 [Polyangia bacterium]|nr:hypothetical protein [Polyangia bacterium]
MDRAADIIPLSSRRPAAVAAPRRVPAAPPKSVRGVLALAGAGLLLVTVVAVSHARTVESVRSLPAADRAALYHRSLEDVDRSCTTSDARDGALRDHCLRQAEFLTLFPECDAGCQKLTASILPHARR